MTKPDQASCPQSAMITGELVFPLEDPTASVALTTSMPLETCARTQYSTVEATVDVLSTKPTSHKICIIYISGTNNKHLGNGPDKKTQILLARLRCSSSPAGLESMRSNRWYLRQDHHHCSCHSNLIKKQISKM